jgi:hypothetical protein
MKVFLTRSFCLLLSHYVLSHGFTSVYYLGLRSATRRQKCLTVGSDGRYNGRAIRIRSIEQETSTASVTVHHMEQKQAKLRKCGEPCSLLLLLFSTYALQASRLIVRSGSDVPTFATNRLHACHYARAPSGGRLNCEREMSENFA